MDTCELFDVDSLDERELPTLVINGEAYYVDSHRRELRNVFHPFDRIGFHVV